MPQPLSCPSAQIGMQELRLLGVVEPTPEGPRVAYLNEDVPVTDAVLSQVAPMEPTRVFRFAAQCEATRCVHFSGERCQLATRIVQLLPGVVDALPVCLIRSTCRWFYQEGPNACLRCPQVVTEASDASAAYRQVATPQTIKEQ